MDVSIYLELTNMPKFRDLKGEKFGRLTPLEVYGKGKHNKITWLCQCDCGKQKIVSSNCLVSGHNISCGCAHEYLDLSIIGKRFKKLVVLSFKEKRKNHYYYECLCDCGNITTLNKRAIKTNAESCGCHLKGSKNPRWTGYEEISGSQWGHIKNHAEKRNLEFSITIEYAWYLFLKQNRKCKLTSLPIKLASQVSGETTASLDRIDSTKGYIEGNVQWIHKDLQDMKWDKPEKYFIKLCHMVAKTHPIEELPV